MTEPDLENVYATLASVGVDLDEPRRAALAADGAPTIALLGTLPRDGLGETSPAGTFRASWE